MKGGLETESQILFKWAECPYFQNRALMDLAGSIELCETEKTSPLADKDAFDILKRLKRNILKER